MNVSLTPELEQFVEEKVTTGLYNSASEVIRDALRLLRQQEIVRQQRLEEMRGEIALGIEQADRGEIGIFDPESLKRRVRDQIQDNQLGENTDEQTL